MKRQWNRKEFYICGLLMVLGTIAYHSLYLLNVYPFTEGWGIYYAELLGRGQIPYRDFFYYLPPLGLLIDRLHWTLSFGNLLVFRAWYFVQRVVMLWLLYCLLTKWFAPRYAWIACLTGIILRTAIVWDLGGDYNQTQTLFAILLTYAVVIFLEKDANQEVESIWRYKYIFLAGAIIALMVLLKQSAGLAALIVCFVFLIAYCIVFRDKRFFRYCVATAAGALIPLGVCGGWLVYNDALIPFFEQFFGVAGAKGGIGTILFTGWYSVLSHWKHVLMFVSFLLMIWSISEHNKGNIHTIVVVAQAAVFVISCAVSYRDAIFAFLRLVLSSTTLIVLAAVFLLFVAVMLIVNRSHSIKKSRDLQNVGFESVLYFGVLIILTLNIRGITGSLFRETSMFVDIPSIITGFSLYTCLLFIISQFACYAVNGKLCYELPMTFVFAGAIADAYANMMNSSDTVYPITAFIGAAIMICILFQIDLKKWNTVKEILTCVLCVVICASAAVQKYTTAYSWWGAEVTYSFSQRNQVVDIPSMAGLRLAEQRKLEFEQVTKLIQENDEEDSTVWGYPHVKIFNILTDHYNTDDPVPVLFYDVCSDSAAQKEAAWLRENHPDFVVWCDMPWCVEVHEETFRNGEPLGQREIISWFTEVKDKSYIKIGQVDNLFVYKRNDGRPINYTYFQDPYAVNWTAGEINSDIE